jgi:outer membrane protein OmpA-like peptidoglycan-associated protein
MMTAPRRDTIGKKGARTRLSAGLVILCAAGLAGQKDLDKEAWMVVPDFAEARPRVVAVVPMINMSLEARIGESLQEEVYKRLQSKGYQKIEAGRVGQVMKNLGIQTPEMLSGISYQRLGRELNCQAVIQGQVNQSGTQHKGVYDAVVVSCSLQMIDCGTGRVLWRAEQFRTAHRQWQADPLNALINLISHEKTDRRSRVAWLVQEMFRTLPQGPIQIVEDDLLSRAVRIEADITEPMKKLEAEEDEETITIELLSDILFDSDSADIKPQAEETLKNLLPIVKKFDRGEITITGFTDDTGREDYNKALSLKRAQACQTWIIEHMEIENQTFVLRGMGESQPAVPNDSEENRAKNRRVEVIITKNRKGPEGREAGGPG